MMEADDMHDSAYRIGELVMHTYSDLANAKILELGSLDVNGSLRNAAAPTTHYVGLDLEAGPSVDFVIAPGAEFPVEEESFDLVMASCVFEHDARFWDTFVRMCRATRAGGHIYVNAPSNGAVHRYPMDYWRFYPDAGLALVEHARSEGLEIDLVESFIGNRHSDIWNDFAAVFRKGPSTEPMNTAFVYQRYPSLNARTWQSGALYNPTERTEDMTLIDDLRRRDTAPSNAATEELAGKLIILESNLRQRQEEIEQAWTKAEHLTSERDALHHRVKDLEAAQTQLQTRLASADKWVFDLAGERRKLEKSLSAVQSELEKARIAILRVEAVSEFKQRQLQEKTEIILAGVARLQGLEPTPDVLHAQTTRLLREWREEAHPLVDLATLLHSVAQSICSAGTQLGMEQRNTADEAFKNISERKAALHDDMERLVAHLEDREQSLHQTQKVIAELNQSVTSLRSDALEYHAKAAQALEQLDLLTAQNKQLSRTLRGLEERLARKDRELAWFRRLFQFLERAGHGWKAALPAFVQQKLTLRTLKRTGHFDAGAYLDKYPDVAQAGMDPLRHYILHGMTEGRFVDASG